MINTGDSAIMGESEKMLKHPSDPSNDLLRRSLVPDPNSTREIPLTRGKVAIVDAADYGFLSQWKWHVSPQSKHGGGYALRTSRKADGLPKMNSAIYMHRVIMGLSPEDVRRIDHRDGDKLNNRRANLRIATVEQNNQNTFRRRDNTSGVKGVYWHKHRRRWLARITTNGKRTMLGYFGRKEDAAAAYRAAALAEHGEFARIE